MQGTQALESGIDAALLSMEKKRREFLEAQTRGNEEWKGRLTQLGGEFDRLRDVWKPRLELLVRKFGDKIKATPTLTPSAREVTFQLQTDAARVRLRFQATTDPDIRKVILNYNLEIIPVLMQFDSHAELEMPLGAVDSERVAAWVDERILSFIRTYVSLHENQFYLKNQNQSLTAAGATAGPSPTYAH